VLGPLLYALYTADLFHIVACHGLRIHMYADDCQVYLSTSATDAATAVDRLSTCVTNINDWMTASQLRLNPTKTQVMWLGSSQQLDKIAIKEVPLLSTRVMVVDTARDLGVVLDCQLSFDAHVCRSGYYQLRQLRPITRSLSVEAAVTSPGIYIKPPGLLQRSIAWLIVVITLKTCIDKLNCHRETTQCRQSDSGRWAPGLSIAPCLPSPQVCSRVYGWLMVYLYLSLNISLRQVGLLVQYAQGQPHIHIQQLSLPTVPEWPGSSRN